MSYARSVQRQHRISKVLSGSYRGTDGTGERRLFRCHRDDRLTSGHDTGWLHACSRRACLIHTYTRSCGGLGGDVPACHAGRLGGGVGRQRGGDGAQWRGRDGGRWQPLEEDPASWTSFPFFVNGHHPPTMATLWNLALAVAPGRPYNGKCAWPGCCLMRNDVTGIYAGAEGCTCH
jgi:hypothetical protein